MRPLEILLSLANLLTFLGLAVARLRALRWTRYSALLALLLANIQALLEGARWQMIPAYVLSGVFSLAGLLRGGKRTGIASGQGWAKRFVPHLDAALGALGLAVSAALPIILPVFRFPRPTGPYKIGTVTYHWVDDGRPEVFTADRNDRRELMVQIWYPAKADPSSPRAPYIEDAGVLAPALARLINLPGFALGHLKYVTTNAVPSAPVADNERSYPVLILLSGRYGYRQAQTFQVEELVSHGYVVASIDQPYAYARVVFPDGRQAAYDARMDDPTFKDSVIPYLAQDVVFTLGQLAALNQADPHGILTGQLDLQRVGLFGHSLGGIVGAEACRVEPRLRACLLEDAFMPPNVVHTGLQQPTMWITRDAETMRLERQLAGGWSEADIHKHLTTMRAVFESLPGDGYYVQVSGMFHVDMNDAPLLSPLASRMGLSGPIGGKRAHRIVNAYSLAFFDRHLKGRPAPLLDGPAEQYPQVRFETRRSVSTAL